MDELMKMCNEAKTKQMLREQNQALYLKTLAAMRAVSADTIAQLRQSADYVASLNTMEKTTIEDIWMPGDIRPEETTETIVVIHDKKLEYYLPDYAIYIPDAGWSYVNDSTMIEDADTEVFAWMQPVFPEWIEEKLKENEE